MEVFTIKSYGDYDKVVDELIPNGYTGIIQSEPGDYLPPALFENELIPENIVYQIHFSKEPIKIYYENGLISNKNGSAILFLNEENYLWALNGKIHRENKPAIKMVSLDGNIYYNFIENNKLIKTISKSSHIKSIMYYKNNKPHRSIRQNYYDKKDIWEIEYYIGDDVVKQIKITQDKLLKMEPDVEYIL